ncbi:MAG TPA: tRNA pseudouridine(38-40) synthase TruA [Rectinemataceae bacterium]|nr:tRNA pseudouridine(38-40) synthase TruA [Rectinemataceae bacterium]
MTNRRNIRLVLSYDGTGLGGWQRQSNARSVQEELEAALATMHGHPVPTIGAGRTDAGVHALGQVANFYTDIASIPAHRFVPALNSLMSEDVRVLKASDADWDFHSRYDARLRRYRYFAVCGGPADPFRLRYAHQLGRRPDLVALNAMAALILGENDFTAFSAAGDASENRSRFVHESSFRWEADQLVYEVAANAFLWRMVRSLVGSMLFFEEEARRAHGEELGARRAQATERMRSALSSRDRRLAGPTAPARGLFLWNVEYYPSPTRPGRGDYWAEREAPGGVKTASKD